MPSNNSPDTLENQSKAVLLSPYQNDLVFDRSMDARGSWDIFARKHGEGVDKSFGVKRKLIQVIFVFLNEAFIVHLKGPVTNTQEPPATKLRFPSNSQ